MFCFSALVLSIVLLNKCFCMYLCFSLLTLTQFNNLAIYNVADDAYNFNQVMHMIIPMDLIDHRGSPNSAHWLWDGTLFTVSTIDSVFFCDSSIGKIVETVGTPTSILNHVIASKKSCSNKHVAGTLKKHFLFLLLINTID